MHGCNAGTVRGAAAAARGHDVCNMSVPAMLTSHHQAHLDKLQHFFEQACCCCGRPKCARQWHQCSFAHGQPHILGEILTQSFRLGCDLLQLLHMVDHSACFAQANWRADEISDMAMTSDNSSQFSLALWVAQQDATHRVDALLVAELGPHLLVIP